MGGFGSGRPSGGGRETVESCRSIDVNRLCKAGCLRPGWSGGWEWKHEGERIASIQLRSDASYVHLSYRMRKGEGPWHDVEEAIRIVQIPCRFGGTRPYFICPGVVSGIACGRRVTKLHGPGRYFLCRHCCNLAYASQGERELDRALRRANRIRRRLGGDPGIVSIFPKKPKGMWERTYHRLRTTVLDTEFQAEEAIELKADRLLNQLDRRMQPKGFWP